ncbi:MAG: GntR family transcriptional regulator [Lachnospiraceae bacterium]|nr:GntR family transcriptional regulator [Lachnospiraceae bacterium]
MEKNLKKYEMIKQDLIRQIDAQELKENQVIPSENMLCEQHQVSRITVRKAIDELVYEGLLYRIKGKGCFVREHKKNELSHIYSYTEAIIHQGKVPSKKLIELKKEKADGKTAKKLHIKEGEEVYFVKNLYLADGKPYCLNQSILPANIFPKLECFNLGENSLYEILKNFYELSMTRVQQKIIATVGTTEVNRYMGLDKKNPLLKIDATSYCLYDKNEIIFECYESYLLTDILSYSIEKYN